MLDKLGGRKTLAFLLALVLGTVIVIVKGDIPEHYATFLEVIFGVFVTGNVGTKLVGKSAVSETKTVEPSPDLTNLSNGLISVQELLKLIIRRAGIDRMPEPPTS